MMRVTTKASIVVTRVNVSQNHIAYLVLSAGFLSSGVFGKTGEQELILGIPDSINCIERLGINSTPTELVSLPFYR